MVTTQTGPCSSMKSRPDDRGVSSLISAAVMTAPVGQKYLNKPGKMVCCYRVGRGGGFNPAGRCRLDRELLLGGASGYTGSCQARIWPCASSCAL